MQSINIEKINSGAIISDKKKLMMFVERYLELSSELSHKKGEAGAHLQLGLLKQEEVFLYIGFVRGNMVNALSIIKRQEC